MKSLYIVLLTLAAIAAFGGRALANTYYVAPTGNDSNPGTATQPWSTLQHAVDSIVPGDTILVESGTYAGCRIGRSGQAGAVCTLKADAGAKVVVNAPGPANKHSSNIEIELFYSTVNYWVIDGFEVANSPHEGIDIRGTDHITIQNCYVHNSANTGIFLAFSYHPLIQSNESANNGEHGIYQSNSGDYPTIRGNNLHHNYAAGIHMNGDVRYKPGDGIISFGLIENNVIWENGKGGGSAINMDGASDNIVQNNLVCNNHASGISLYAIDGAEGSSRNMVYNNTFVMASDARWVVNIPKSAKGKPNPTGNQIMNNTLYTPRPDRGSILIYSSTAAGFKSDYNVVVNRFSADGGKTIIPLAKWQAFGYDLHSTIATPSVGLWIRPSINDHLKAGPPAINARTPSLQRDLSNEEQHGEQVNEQCPWRLRPAIKFAWG